MLFFIVGVLKNLQLKIKYFSLIYDLNRGIFIFWRGWEDGTVDTKGGRAIEQIPFQPVLHKINVNIKQII